MDRVLQGFTVVSTAIYVPGPVAVARLQSLGARVIKVEPPGGDPLAPLWPGWYAELTAGQEVVQLDLKQPAARDQLEELLAAADLLLTATRPAALERLGLGWPALHARHPGLCHVAIVGYPPPHENTAGHDLTYQAHEGLLTPPHMPRSFIADLAGAERAASAALALLLGRARGQEAGHVMVALSEAAAGFAAPFHHGVTRPGAQLAGGAPYYNLYRAQDGWVALAALEPHFWRRVQFQLGMEEEPDYEALAAIFATRPAAEWEAWAAERDVPLVVVR